MFTLSKVQKWRRLFVRLLFALVVVSVAFWISTKREKEIIMVDMESKHESITLVPRGQTFFHSYPESNRYTSDDTWRPHEFYQPNQMLRNKRHTNSHFHQELPREDIEGADRILLLVKSSMQTIWKQLPTHLFTTLTQFPNAILYSDGPDSVGGIEVVDIISHIDKQQLRKSAQFLYYRIHRSLRDKHVYIAPDQVHVADSELLDKFKYLHMLLHAWDQQKAQHYEQSIHDLTGYILPKGTDQPPARDSNIFNWYVIVDDDSFIMGASMIEFLNKLDPSKPHYLGSAVGNDGELEFADGGSGVILSREAMRIAFDHGKAYDWVEEYTRIAEEETRGDYVLARFLKEKCEIELSRGTSDDHFQGLPVWKVHFGAHNWCKEVFTFADQTSRDMELLWEYQRVKPKNLLFVDFYLDFAKPFFPASAQKNWDNGANSIEYSPGDGEYDHEAPYASYEKCNRACKDNGNCLMFRHDSYTHYCGLGIQTISLGRPTIKYTTPTNEEMCRKHKVMCNERAKGEEIISGWVLSRVREMRTTMSCDPLSENPFIEGEEGNALDQTEGWWLRAKERYGSGAKDPLA